MTDPYAAFSDPVGSTRVRPRQPAPVAQYQGELPTDPAAVFQSLVTQESGGRTGVLGPQTAYGRAEGRTQMLPATARETAMRIGVPWRPELMRATTPEAAAYQDQLGLAYLTQGYQETGNMRDALRYYHGGPNRRLWGPKTQAYSEQILGRVGGQAPVLTAQPARPQQASGNDPYAEFSEPFVPHDSGPVNAAGMESLLNRAGSSPENPFEITPETPREQLSGLTKGTWIKVGDQVHRLAGDAYVNENGPQGDQVAPGGNAYLHTVDGEDALRAFTTAAAEQIPFLDEAAQGATALATGRSFSDVRDQYQAMNAVDNQTNRGMRDIGGIAGGVGTAFLPGVNAGGEFIGQGANVADKIARASLVGAGGGAVFGASQADGGLAERAQGAATGALTGFGAGAIGQGVLERLGVARAPSAARRLSRQGIDLTPGQMASEIPGVGSTVKYLEDTAGGFNPLMGGVRQRQNEQVIRAAGNEALSHVQATLPKQARTGYQVSQAVMKVLGDQYDQILPRIQAQADADLSTDLADMVSRAGQTLDDSHLGRLQRVLDQNVINRFTPGGVLDGEQFKRIETTLRQQSERSNRFNSTLEDQDLSEFLDETRDIVRNLIARHNPAEADRIREINSGYAVAKRVQRAVSGSAQVARNGTPTPGELTNTVVQMARPGQVANETALLQGLASDARSVLPSGVGDTGSGQKAVLGGMVGVLGTGGIAAVNPLLAAGIASGAILYSRPGIMALNAVYRATDSQASGAALRLLAQSAQRTPALVPYYEAALQHVAGTERTQSPTTQPAPRSAPVPTLVQ